MQARRGGGYGAVGDRSQAALREDLLDGVLSREGLPPYGVTLNDDGSLTQFEPGDEMTLEDVDFVDGHLLIPYCRPGEKVISTLSLETGQMVELVPPAGPPLRFWVHAQGERETALELAAHWTDRLPPGPYRRRATTTGTPEFVNPEL